MSQISPEKADSLLDSLIDELASIEHARWAHWQSYVHSQGERQDDGSIILPAPLVAKWDRQISTPYEDLSHDEKSADREQVRRYLPLIRQTLLDGDLDC